MDLADTIVGVLVSVVLAVAMICSFWYIANLDDNDDDDDDSNGDGWGYV